MNGGISGIFGGEAVAADIMVGVLPVIVPIVAAMEDELCGWLLLRFRNGGISGMWTAGVEVLVDGGGLLK